MSTNDEYVTNDGRAVGCVQHGPIFEAFAAETASGVVGPQETGHHRTLGLTVAVSAVAGTGGPSLTVTVQTSSDGATWRSAGATAAITAVGSTRISVGGLDRFVRLSYAIAGTTPSFTFATSGELV